MAAACAELVNLPRRLPREMIADPPTDTRRPAIISSFWRDIRHALRLLRTRPGFAAVAVTTLALGIGANTAIFSVVRSVLLEPIPFPDPDRLVLLWEAPADSPTKTFIVSAPNYVDWRRDVKSFEHSRHLGIPDLQSVRRRRAGARVGDAGVFFDVRDAGRPRLLAGPSQPTRINRGTT